MMRILFVVHAFVPESIGGVELHCHYLAAALAEKGHDAAVFARQADATKPDYELEKRRQGSLTVWRVNHCYRDVVTFAGTYRNERIDGIFDQVAEQWRPDIVHVHHLIGLSTGIFERTKHRGLPLVLGLHDYWFGCPRGQRIRNGLRLCDDIDRNLCVPCLKPQNYEVRTLHGSFVQWLRRLQAPTYRPGLRILRQYDADMRRALALPDAVVTPAHFHREMYAHYGVDPNKVHIVPYGFPKPAFAGMERRRGEPFRVGFVGTLIPSKGVHILLEAYRLLGRPDVMLEIHGPSVPYHGDAGYLDRLKEAAAGIPGTIRFHGRYDPADAPRILSSLDALVVPSLWYECAPLVIREGFLAGVPVVASGHGGMAEAIDHSVNGLLFRPGNAGDLAVQLRLLLEKPDLWQRLAQYPQRVASVEDGTALHLDLYQSLLGDRDREA